MKFKIEIEMDNAAFEDNPDAEVIRILESAIFQIKRRGDIGALDGRPLHDINGNTVGKIRVTK